jgi:cytochrome c peroxidase
LELREGVATDLLPIAMRPPLGLPQVPVPADNPLTREKIELGRQLFYDRRLSLNDTFSCAISRNRDSPATSWPWRWVSRGAPYGATRPLSTT